MTCPRSAEDWREVGAAHVLAMDIFWAREDAFGSGRGIHLKQAWDALSKKERDMFIAQAAAVLEWHRPHLIGPDIATGLRRDDKIIGGINAPKEL